MTAVKGESDMPTLTVKSPAFTEGGFIPEKHTGRGEDISPAFTLDGLDPNAKSIAITLDDASHPIPNYNHWVIWNIPVLQTIPEGIPHGQSVESLIGAVQGRGYGKNRYRGPNPPFRWKHTYVFTVYVLDCACKLTHNSTKRDLLQAAKGHILQQATLSGVFQSR